MFPNAFMEMYGQYSLPPSFRLSSSYQEEPLEAAASSLQRATHSDEEVILASSRPKKRAGRKKFKETRHPIYRGVRRRNGNKWVCELRAPNNKSRIWLGTYQTAEMAARAHDVAALAFRGRLACLNFADSASLLPLPANMSIREIQRAAAEAAEAFRPQECSEQTVENVSQETVTTPDQEASTSDKKPEFMEESLPQRVTYVDEEAVFDMPRLLANMAEGLLLSPPYYMHAGVNSNESESDDCEVLLWSYSI
ncbi:basic helix-loop-helix protein [Ancistrocladus abbreviatus]